VEGCVFLVLGESNSEHRCQPCISIRRDSMTAQKPFSDYLGKPNYAPGYPISNDLHYKSVQAVGQQCGAQISVSAQCLEHPLIN
jgi:hypothetical protein